MVVPNNLWLWVVLKLVYVCQIMSISVPNFPKLIWGHKNSLKNKFYSKLPDKKVKNYEMSRIDVKMETL